MNLGEIRSKFIQFSGREDLVNSNGSDNGADFFIGAGQRFLDRRIDFRKSSGRIFKPLAVDAYTIKFNGCRAIERVYINDTEERWKLELKTLEWLRDEYFDTVADTDSGDPIYWSPAMLRGIDIKDMNSVGTFFNFVMNEKGTEDYDGIVILPPPDEAMTVEIFGKFYSPNLVDDSDESYWSAVVPETLIQAALYRLEIFYRNTEGAKDYLAGIEMDLVDIDKDSIHEDNVNVDQLEG